MAAKKKSAKKVAKKPVKKAPAKKAATKKVAAKKATAKKAVKVTVKPVKEKAPKKVAAPKPKKLTRAEIKKQEQVSEMTAKWMGWQKKAKDMEPAVYKMSGVYEERTPLKHSKLGWGFILSNKNHRLEVLFEGGIKYLISNYS